MKIALIHFRAFETDGVSLEMDKWKLALEKAGNEVFFISGSKSNGKNVYLEDLDYRATYNKLIHKNAFQSFEDYESKEEFIDYIYKKADNILKQLIRVIDEKEIDCIVPNNVSSLGVNLPVGIAFSKLADMNKVKIIYHHHDFYWERERYSTPLFEEIENILKDHFPNKNNATHCTINEIAKQELKQRKNIDAVVVPNVFDFESDLWLKDNYNEDLRKRFNIREEDIVFLQATRIVERKAIEIAYRVLEEVQNLLPNHYGKTMYNGVKITSETKIHFVLAGLNELTNEKFEVLDNLLHRKNIKIHYINEVVDHSRRSEPHKIYSLWDVYTMCDFITYTSILEGWGNQLLEGLFAMKPLLVYEYPVFKTDIKQFKFDLVSIDEELQREEDSKLYFVSDETTKEKGKEIWSILLDNERYIESADKNFEIANRWLSYEALYEKLRTIFE